MEDAQAAFEALARRSRTYAMNRAWKLTRNRELADDLVQETYLRAWRNFDSFRRDCVFEHWLLRIMTYVFLDDLRKIDRRPSCVSYDALEGEEPSFFAVDQFEEEVFAQYPSGEVAKILDRLTPDERNLMVEHFVDGATYREMGVRHGRTHTVIARRLKRVAAKMQAATGHSSTHGST